jgi:hypothetical protein
MKKTKGQERYMLVRNGRTTRWGNPNGTRLWPIAKTHEEAVRLKRYLRAEDATVAKIGSVQGETLQGLIYLAIADGCVGACCPMGWNGDEPQWGFIMFD